MSHPNPSFDWTEKHRAETPKEYGHRKAKALGEIASKMTPKKLNVQSSQHGERKLKYDRLSKSMKEPYSMELKKGFSKSDKSRKELHKMSSKMKSQ